MLPFRVRCWGPIIMFCVARSIFSSSRFVYGAEPWTATNYTRRQNLAQSGPKVDSMDQTCTDKRIFDVWDRYLTLWLSVPTRLHTARTLVSVPWLSPVRGRPDRRRQEPYDVRIRLPRASTRWTLRDGVCPCGESSSGCDPGHEIIEGASSPLPQIRSRRLAIFRKRMRLKVVFLRMIPGYQITR